jgi:hypothetical protein
VTAQPAAVLPLCISASLPSLSGQPPLVFLAQEAALPIGGEPAPCRSLLMPPRHLAEEEDDDDDSADVDDDEDEDDEDEEDEDGDDEDDDEDEEDEDEADDEDEDEEDEDDEDEKEDDAPPARRP